MAPEARLKSQVHLNLVFDLAVKITPGIYRPNKSQISNLSNRASNLWLMIGPMLVKQVLIRVGFLTLSLSFFVANSKIFLVNSAQACKACIGLTCSWKGLLVRSFSWKVLSWKEVSN